MNIVSGKYVYEDVVCNTPEKTRYIFECLLDAVSPSGLEVDNLYYASQMGEFIGGKIPAATLTALVKRGMLHCDGKVEGKNTYAITNEIYDYFINCYRPTKEAYKREINEWQNRKK